MARNTRKDRHPDDVAVRRVAFVAFLIFLLYAYLSIH